uniref:Uncharacterized protein n=1 Tax=viral metagenome TaxID=1070528 RepID=A0A6H1Z9V9_9ZZZZ
MLRKPTKEELSFINEKIAKKEMKSDDCMIIDAVPANDTNLTVYYYRLGHSSLRNFRKNLDAGEVPALVNHDPKIPIGRWLKGVVRKENDGHVLKAPVYMPKGLELDGYSTEHLANAYETGTLTDVSVGWADGKPICDICKKDVRDPECKHWPGQPYNDAKDIATCTIENANLKEISFVWKGGLPGAEFLDYEQEGEQMEDSLQILSEEGQILDWTNIKEIDIHGQLVGTLSMPIKSETETIEGREKELTLQEALEKYKKEISEMFVEKSLFDQVTGEIQDITLKYAEINSEIEADKDFTSIGKVRIVELKEEYHRLGVAVNGDTWNQEAEEAFLEAMTVAERRQYMESKIEANKEILRVLTEKKEIEEEKEKAKKSDVVPHKQRDEHYKLR